MKNPKLEETEKVMKSVKEMKIELSDKIVIDRSIEKMLKDIMNNPKK